MNTSRMQDATRHAGPRHESDDDERLLIIADPAPAREALSQLRFAPRAPKVVGVALLTPTADAPKAIAGAPVVGDARNLPGLRRATGFTAALICAPLAQSEAALRVREALAALNAPAGFLPCIADVLANPQTPPIPPPERAPIAALAPPPPAPPDDSDLAALVGRSPRPLNLTAMAPLIEGRRVLITGAGGSIGSELARLAAALSPARLILMERAENALFEIDRQLAARAPGVDRVAVLHDVTDEAGTRRIFERERPQVVFHAAAHKHVPLMEDHPVQAIANNTLGAAQAASAAIDVNAERFVFISTDKAVHPTSVMGATKRLAELAIRRLHDDARAAGARTRLRMVRFGNVLGSSCSVLPIWDQQIAEGGPVTVTDPRMTRFFMTIPEAANLVLRAGALDPNQVDGADLFVLDMGKPVRIFDLALRFVRLRGFAPVVSDARTGVEIARASQPSGGKTAQPPMSVRIVGARPGEKLHEELAYTAEDLRPTPAPGVLAWAGRVDDPAGIDRMLTEMRHAVQTGAAEDALSALQRWIPTLTRRVIRPVVAPPRVGAA